VLVGGVDVRELDPGILWSTIGLVPQRPYLFSGTVASNLRYGKPDATEAEMWDALRVAQAEDFVRAMGGLEARIEQGGTNVSGGQRQRLAIARALSTHARLIVLDEPVSALDVSIRAHIIGLLEEIQARLGVSYLFIAHDLAAVAHISHQIAVMYLGKIVEIADSLDLCDKPLHPYTKALFAASLPSHPDEEREEIVLTGEVPSALNPPSGCHFHPRCPFAMPRCSGQEPELVEVSAGHHVACYLY
jgi:oligopeptide/dipeptide ABC transporter ATP-binding protein